MFRLHLNDPLCNDFALIWDRFSQPHATPRVPCGKTLRVTSARLNWLLLWRLRSVVARTLFRAATRVIQVLPGQV